MKKIDRRNFIKTSVLGTAGLGLVPAGGAEGKPKAAAQATATTRVVGANGDIRYAVVGFNGRGRDHLGGMHGVKGTRLVALCDVDSHVLEAEVKKCDAHGEKVEGYTDVRKLLENKDIDVVTFATPNHWHSLGAIWAVQAGKDVYVEKPVSHNVWEGRQVVMAARKHGKIVQAGTQSRTNPGLREAIGWLHEGHIGKIIRARGLCYKRRPSIGKVDGPQPVPPNIDYDLWCGPAPKEPLMRTRLHYDWHWVWNTGCGGLGNQGIHEMDVARWFLGVMELSPRVFAVGGRLGYVDDGETPNTMVIYHDYPEAPLIFEVRGLPSKSGSKEMDHYKGLRSGVGVSIESEGGQVAISSYGAATVYDKEGQVIKEFKGAQDHHENWLKAVRNRKRETLNADILEGHLSSALCHTGNISYRIGATKPPGEIKEAIKSDKGL